MTAWTNTFTGILCISVDILTASVVWKHEDVTVSSLCGLELRKQFGGRVLRGLGRVLNRIQANHCEQAILSDRARARGALAFLGQPDRTDQLRDALAITRAQWIRTPYAVQCLQALGELAK